VAPAQAGRAGWGVTALGFVASFLLALRVLLGGDVAPRFDAHSAFAPWQMLVADFARAGRVLLWNAWSNGGSPDFAEPQVGAFSPLAVGVGALTGGSTAGFLLYWLLSWGLGGLGVLLLARQLGAPAWGGFVAALGFAFSGFFTGHAQHVSMIHTLSFVPWIVWRLDAALERERWLPAVQAGALWGLSGLAGYPGLVLMSGAYVGLWALGRVLCRAPRAGPDRRRDALRALLYVALVAAIGVAVLSPTYLGLLIEGRGFSERAGALPRAVAIGDNALHPGALATFASPYLAMLRLYDPDLWSYTDVSSASVYVGPLVPCLALFALVAGPRERWRWWLAGLVVLWLALALGRSLPLRGWFYDWLPPARYFRHAALARGYAIFSLVVLSLHGARELSLRLRARAPVRWRGLVLSGVAVAVAAGLAYAAVLHAATRSGSQLPAANRHALLLWSALVLGLLAIGRLPARARATLVPAGAVLLAALDALGSVGLAQLTIYTGEPARVHAWRQLDARHRAELDLTRSGLQRELGARGTHRNLAAKVATLRGYEGAFESRLHRAWLEHPLLVAAATGRRRLWFAERGLRVAPDQAAFAAFVARVEATQQMPLLLHDPQQMRERLGAAQPATLDPELQRALYELPEVRSVAFSLASYRPDALELTVQAPADGWLLVTERWAPGWQVSVDGRPSELRGGNFLFRAVAVRAGPNTLRFRYAPFGYPGLLALSWGTLALVAAASLLAGGRSPSPRGPAGPD